MISPTILDGLAADAPVLRVPVVVDGMRSEGQWDVPALSQRVALLVQESGGDTAYEAIEAGADKTGN